MTRWLFALCGLILAILCDPFIDSWISSHHFPLSLSLSHALCPLFSPPAAAVMVGGAIFFSLLRRKLTQALDYTESLFVLLMTECAVQVLKFTIGRPRPYDPFLTDSFPSSHTAMLFVLCHALPKFMQPAAYFLALMLALLRLFDGHHHFSDLYAGALLALAIAKWGAIYWNSSPKEISKEI